MYRFITLSLATCLALTGAIAIGITDREQSLETQMATDGAFRDGLFVGRWDAEQGRSGPAPIGRWSGEQDRESFTAGYRMGLGEPSH
jgi:hypothetical protein